MTSPCHAGADIFTCGKKAVGHSERLKVPRRADFEVDEIESKKGGKIGRRAFFKILQLMMATPIKGQEVIG